MQVSNVDRIDIALQGGRGVSDRDGHGGSGAAQDGIGGAEYRDPDGNREGPAPRGLSERGISGEQDLGR